jgi:tRNA wybutosine-synthesizing protein 1
MRTLELLPSLDTRKVIRHTLVKDMNLGWVDEYAKLDKIADTDMIEPKGYVFVGSSRMRLHNANMPSFEEIMDFSTRLGDIVGMEVIKQKPDSRVVLLAKDGVETDVRKYYHLDE